MNEVTDINIWDLVLALTTLTIPMLIFLYYRIKLVRDLFVSMIRMILQLMLVAVYLEWIFNRNNAWINSLWVLVMVLVSAGTIVYRVKLSWKMFLVPFMLAGVLTMVFIDAFFIGFVVRPEYFFDARYLVPISGMVLGNSLNHNVVGLSTFFDGLSEKRELYYFLLTNSGSRKNALRPFIREAIVKSLNPLLATMSVIGLISLPGMMTGQILGGSSPAIAIKYQLMIMIAILVGATSGLTLSIWFSVKIILDDYGNIRKKR
jgi:putative ABC transport system permease protein